MRKIINKKTAIRITTFLIALICIMTIFPLRIFADTLETSGGGELTEDVGLVHVEYAVTQEFVSRYKRLKSIDVYVSEMTNGRYISARLMDENHADVVQTFVDTADYQLPGYVKVPFEINIEPGKKYFLVMEACKSKYNVGYEDVPENPEYVGSLYCNWVDIPGRHLAAIYYYRVPMSKTKSLGIISVIAAIALIIYVGTGLYYRRFPDKNRLLTVGKLLKVVANPLNVLVFGALMIMTFPLKMFDQRPADIIFYEIGLLICAGIVWYAINHNVVKQNIGVSFWQSIRMSDRFKYCLMMFTIAMTLWYACAYMNDLYDIYHTLSERRMMIWLILTMLLTFSAKEALNVVNLIWVIASSAFGILFYHNNALADTEKEYDLHNAALKYGIIIVILGGLVLISLIKRYENVRITGFGIMLLVFFAAIIVFRNTRWWGVALAVSFTCLYLRISLWKHRKDWYKVLAGGLMLNFVLSLAFSILHRYFPAYVSGRFAFIFHTVTVTAEYLTLMAAVASVMLVIKIVAIPQKSGIVVLFKSAWKEIVLFGWIMAYAIFTVSRTAYLAIGVTVIAVIIVVMARHKKQFFRIVGPMMASVVICFPGAFTLQRIVPPMVGDPVFYVIDDANTFVRGGAAWDNTNYMCVERFINLFSGKILGHEIGYYNYPTDANNYDKDGNPIFDQYGYPLDESNDPVYFQGRSETGYEMAKDLLASATFTGAEYEKLLEELSDYVDAGNKLDVISNGRITIFKCYLKEMNLTGHDEMGVLLPNGEIAIHAHNTYIQMAYDHGVPVGILFVIILITAMVLGIRSYRRSQKGGELILLIFAMTMGFVVAGVSEWVYQLCNPMTVALMMSFAGLVYKEKKTNNG